VTDEERVLGLEPGTRVRHKRLTNFGVGTVLEEQPDAPVGCSCVRWDQLPPGVPVQAWFHATKLLIKVQSDE
jgi:hypothetical protein